MKWLELLQKLTRLANNNPNDNEANLAARKVCKMLEEGKWNIPSAPAKPIENRPKSTWEPKIADWYDPKTRMLKISISDADLIANPQIQRLLAQLDTEINRKPAETWNDVHRSTEPNFKSKPPDPGFNQYQYDNWQHIWEQYRQQTAQRAEEERRRQEEKAQKAQDPFFNARRGRGVPFDYAFWDEPIYTPPIDFDPLRTPDEPKKSAADATNKP